MIVTNTPYGPIIERFRTSAPVDVSGLAQALGLTVWEDDGLPEGISGKICKDTENGGSAGFSIIVRASDPFVRRRFTVAHEIAHFVLHRERIGDSLTDDALYRSGLTSREEVDANRYAAEILMPRQLIGRYIKEYGSSDPSILAPIFKVSEQAMRIRLGSLT